MDLINRLYREEDGQGITEYLLILTFIAVALIASLKILKGDLANAYNDAGEQLPP